MKKFLLFLLLLLCFKLPAFSDLSWIQVKGIPKPSLNSFSASTYNDKIYVIGGDIPYNATNTVYTYDGTNWTQIVSLPAVQEANCSAVLNNKLYSIGGIKTSSSGQTNVYCFDGTNWAEVKGLPAGRKYHASVTFNNKIYVIGGNVSSGATTNVYVFDGTNWAQTVGLPIGMNSSSAEVLSNKIYVIGGNDGQTAANFTALTNVFSYDGTNWSSCVGLPSSRSSFASVTLNNKIYIMGGENGAYSANEYTNVFSFNGVNWIEVTGLPIESVWAKSSALGNNLYYIGGTRNSGGTIFTNVYMATEFFIPLKPTNPIPTNTAINQPTNTIISWQDGGNSTGYIINFGLFNAITNCGSTTTTNYNPGMLLYGSNYQWRIDATNATGVTTGDVWSFTVRDGNWYVATNGTGQGLSWEDATNNLQKAITACSSNYTVWVSNGTYITNLTVGGGVTVRSKTGIPTDVILNGNHAGRVVYMQVSSWLIGCTVTNGSVSDGAGVYSGSVSNSIISGNSANVDGGGGFGSAFYNSIINGNTAGSFGGGGCQCAFYNCIISINTAQVGGGGSDSAMYNSTLYSNTATVVGGGGYRSSFNNSISWNNSKVDYFADGGAESYSCGVGYVGAGSITNDPLFMSDIDFRLQDNSPCIDKGNNAAWSGLSNSVDLDSNKRIWPINGIVDMGAYEYGSQKDYPPPPSKSINPIPTNGATRQLIPTIVSWQNDTNSTGCKVNFGLFSNMTNCGSTTSTNYNLGLLLYGSNYQWRIDATNATGVTTGDVWSFTVRDVGNLYVATNGTGMGTSWEDAINDLPGAVASCPSNYTVWVSNGTYVINLIVGEGVTVRSKTGLPADVILNGNAIGRVVSNSATSLLIGVTLTNGFLDGSFNSGSGVENGSLSNCIIVNNVNSYYGGGAFNSTLNNCIISGNTAWIGGGASLSILNNCLLINNIANNNSGGGAFNSTLNNCTIVGNTASWGGGVRGGQENNCISWNNSTVDYQISEYYSCGVGYTGIGSITNNPLFVSASDFHLQDGSPCLANGNISAWVGIINSVDLDGNPRIWHGKVDMGAYELMTGEYFLWVKP